ncbi:hypothetical protein SAMN04487887_103129 [Enterococcus casseliflavus]|uniref:hypothetical protein n=1 Tax=Enterococcus TaxID=1350 RepID=UPI0008EDAABC|nr:hypothetical protein [Enterococcus casseliflavus]SFD70593.1 hypothetical protein SAMN04487887_103129 [Enterococcus casseliflavus]
MKVTKEEELIDLLKQFPRQMVSTMRGMDKKLSPLHLAKNILKLKGSSIQCLVICDKWVYEKYY